MKQNELPYAEWLSVITKTRLLFNTTAELEQMLDCKCIDSNGITRCCNTPQKLRATFRDLKEEVKAWTNGAIELDKILIEYKKTSAFYAKHLRRRSNPESVARDILTYFITPNGYATFHGKKAEICKQIAEEKDINVELLVLMVLKKIPGYDSKEGDVKQMRLQYEEALCFLESFCDEGAKVSLQHLFSEARDEEHPSRIMLLHHTTNIIITYRSFSSHNAIYDVSAAINKQRYKLNLHGYWNTYNGEMNGTDFWQIQHSCDLGAYVFTYWHKDASNRIVGIQYNAFLWEETDEELTLYVVHPEAVKRLLSGMRYGDADNTWYALTKPETNAPEVLSLKRRNFSSKWPAKKELTRVTDKKMINLYDRWLEKECEVVKPYADLEYSFDVNLYAVTKEALYIPTDEQGEYYHIPRNTIEGLERIELSDQVGILKMKDKQYLAFDCILRFIPITKSNLRRYGIERVRLEEKKANKFGISLA